MAPKLDRILPKIFSICFFQERFSLYSRLYLRNLFQKLFLFFFPWTLNDKLEGGGFERSVRNITYLVFVKFIDSLFALSQL